jgi:protein-tyrosine-phosphatase
MQIHFVCSGNVYRSRLAEAYCKYRLATLSAAEIKVSSSGIMADEHRLKNGPIAWYAMRLLKRQQLIPFMAWDSQQTTQKLLNEVDLLICMRQEHLDFCQQIGYQGKFAVWEVPDLNEVPEFIDDDGSRPTLKVDANHIQLSEQTYQLITQKVDRLLSSFLSAK